MVMVVFAFGGMVLTVSTVSPFSMMVCGDGGGRGCGLVVVLPLWLVVAGGGAGDYGWCSWQVLA